jgi:hypothetical protein
VRPGALADDEIRECRRRPRRRTRNRATEKVTLPAFFVE